MDTNRFTSTGGGLRTVFAHWDQNPAGHNRNSTDFTKQATCNNESLPRKNEHKEWTCSSFGSFRGSIHPDRFAILAVLFTFKWSGHWSRPLKTAYLLLGFNHNYGKKTKITHVSMVYLVTCHSYGICFMCRLLIDDLPIVYLYKSMFADDLVILMEMFADGLPLYTCTYTHKNI